MSPEQPRRDFLKISGMGAAAALAACQRLPVRHAIPYLIPPEEITPGVAAHYASTCTACPASCGLLATVRDGRPIKLEGRPEHTLSRGGLCAVGQGDLRALFDPGRVRSPRLKGRDTSWKELDEAVREGLLRTQAEGRSVVVLAPTLVSPSARAAVVDFLESCKGRLVEYDPGAESCSAVLEAYELVNGRAMLPALEIERVDLLVVLGSDLLGAGIDPVVHTAAYAARRRDSGTRGPLRHIQVESSLSLTGAAADERWLATASERRALSLALLRRVAERRDPALLAKLPIPPALPAFESRADALAGQLLAHAGRCLLTSSDNDLALQLVLALTNRLIGNEGRTLDLARPSLVRRGTDRALQELLADLDAKRVGALFVVGLDPVEQLPDGEGLKAHLATLPLSVSISDRPSATAQSCQVVAAAHHGLESWGDAEPRSGVLTLCQPMVRPLFDTRPAFENFLHWSVAGQRDYHLYVAERWKRDILGGGVGVQERWTAAVARGGVEASVPAGSSVPSVASVEAAMSTAPRPTAEAAIGVLRQADFAPSSDSMETELIAEVGLREGTRAHVPWLRELPDPLTRVSWEACVRVAPELAASLSIVDGDVVEIASGNRILRLPARLVAGQHARVLGIPVGYGRTDGDGGDPDRNAYRLLHPDQGRFVRAGLGATARRTGGRINLPLMQLEAGTHGRALVPEVTNYEEHVHAAHHAAGKDLWPRIEKPRPQWHMLIDLDACTGCSACVVACQAENNVAVVGRDEMRRQRDMHWLRIDRYVDGHGEEARVSFQPMLCAQCGHAPCETVCPVAATVHSEDGLNQQVYNRCVGTRYCANNCPYKVRRFNWFNNQPKEPVERLVLNPDVVVRSRGVMEKCTFCVQRIQAARLEARANGDPKVPSPQTACQQSCPAQAITFGDSIDPDGQIARGRARPRAFQVLAELGIEPSVTYLARVRQGAHHGEEA